MSDKSNGIVSERLAELAKREADIRRKITAEQERLRKRKKQDDEKEQSIIGAAVVKAAAVFPELQRMIAETALAHVTDEKQRQLRQFLKDRGWDV
jgi:hypothetical protein